MKENTKYLILSISIVVLIVTTIAFFSIGISNGGLLSQILKVIVLGAVFLFGCIVGVFVIYFGLTYNNSYDGGLEED